MPLSYCHSSFGCQSELGLKRLSDLAKEQQHQDGVKPCCKVTETAFSTYKYILLCSLFELLIPAVGVTEWMSNHIVGLAGIREKRWTLEREKKSANSFCSIFWALKYVGEKSEMVTSYQCSVPKWSQPILSETLLALGRHISWFLSSERRKVVPPDWNSQAWNRWEKKCKCVCLKMYI